MADSDDPPFRRLQSVPDAARIDGLVGRGFRALHCAACGGTRLIEVVTGLWADLDGALDRDLASRALWCADCLAVGKISVVLAEGLHGVELKDRT